MSHLEVDYELLIKDLSRIPKDKRNWFYVIDFIDEWLRNKKISVKSTDEVIKIIKAIKPKLIPKKIFLSPGVTVREFDVSPYTAATSTIFEFTKDLVNKVTIVKNNRDLKKFMR